jgi:polar amino acid transport system permease protein
VLAVPFTLELQFATNAIANRIYKPIPLLLVACIWYLVITTVLMFAQSRARTSFRQGLRCRAMGSKGQQPPLPGKTDG